MASKEVYDVGRVKKVSGPVVVGEGMAGASQLRAWGGRAPRIRFAFAATAARRGAAERGAGAATQLRARCEAATRRRS